MSEPKSWTAIIEENPENTEELFIKFNDDMCKRLGWVEGTTLDWEIKDGKVFIKEVKK